MSETLLRIYLNDHLAGSVGGVEHAEHCLAQSDDAALAAVLRRFLAEVAGEQEVLKTLLSRIGGAENPAKQAVAWVSEKVNRAKPSGNPLGYSPLNRLEELEALVIGVTGKLSLWEALGAVLGTDARFRDIDFAALAEQARRQRADLDRHRLDAARVAFSSAEKTEARS